LEEFLKERQVPLDFSISTDHNISLVVYVNLLRTNEISNRNFLKNVCPKSFSFMCAQVQELQRLQCMSEFTK